MARKLKTYQTSLGFFDQAIAAPSMKAALEAWGADSNLFHQGAARESRDPAVIAATMAQPGIVLKRPVGSNGPFGEHAELPDPGSVGTAAKAARKPATPKPTKASARAVDKAAARQENSKEPHRQTRKTALGQERKEARRERDAAKQQAQQQRDRERRQQAVDKAQAALDRAEQAHADRAVAIELELAALERKSRDEDARWAQEKQRLEAALHRAAGPPDVKGARRR